LPGLEDKKRRIRGEGAVDVIRLLLVHRADVNAKREGQKTPLDLAVEQGNVKVANLLRQNGAIQAG
jgi:ankyrin repeat protein